MHPKKVSIFPSYIGIDFLGCIIFKDHIRLRSKNVKAFRKRLKRFQKLYVSGKFDEQKIKESITSWIAHSKQADTYQLRKKIFGEPLIPKNQKEIHNFIKSWDKLSHKPSCQFHLF